MVTAAVLFALTYLVLGLQRLPRLHIGRPAGALLGAVAMVAFGVLSFEDAKRAIDIGCTGIVLSNHGGRQLDGSRSAFDQLAEVVDAVGDRIDVMMDGGVQRGTHVLKALSLGAKAVGVGRYYLFPLASAGQAGVERALTLMKAELERDMRLMGCSSVKQLSRGNLRFRQEPAHRANSANA